MDGFTPGESYNRALEKIWKSHWMSMDKTGGTLYYNPERSCKIFWRLFYITFVSTMAYQMIPIY